MKRHAELRRTPGYRMPRTAAPGRVGSTLARRGKQYAKRVARAKSFYSSPAWKRIRRETFRIAGYACQLCWWRDATVTGKGLVCDHTSYARFGGMEIPGKDTRCLCKRCDRGETSRSRANHMNGFHNGLTPEVPRVTG